MSDTLLDAPPAPPAPEPPPDWQSVEGLPEFKALPYEQQSKVLSHYTDTLRSHVVSQGADPAAVDAEINRFKDAKTKQLDPLAGLQHFAPSLFTPPAEAEAKRVADLADVQKRATAQDAAATADASQTHFVRGLGTGYQDSINSLANGITRLSGDTETANFFARPQPGARPEPGTLEKVGSAIGGTVPLLATGLPGAVVQASIHGYEGEMEKSGDSTRATFAALRAAPEMAAYWLLGGAASKAIGPLVQQSGPLVKAGAGAIASTIANVLTSAGLRATHGEPIAPDVQGVTQDALFGLMHGVHSGVEAAKSEGGVRDALSKAPTEALEIASADPEFRKSAPYDPKLVDGELAKRNLAEAPDEAVQIAAGDTGFAGAAPDMHAAVLTELEKRGLSPADADRVIAVREAERQAQEARDAGLDETAKALSEKAAAARGEAVPAKPAVDYTKLSQDNVENGQVGRFKVVGSRGRGDFTDKSDFDLVTKLSPEEQKAWEQTPDGEYPVIPQEIKSAANAGHDVFIETEQGHAWKVEPHPVSDDPNHVVVERVSQVEQNLLSGGKKPEKPLSSAPTPVKEGANPAPASAGKPADLEKPVEPLGKKTQLDLILDSAIKQGHAEVTIPISPEKATREYIQKVVSHIESKGLSAGASNDGVLVRGFNEHRSALAGEPINAATVDALGIKLPEGYEKQGDLYVFKPEAARPALPSNTQVTVAARTAKGKEVQLKMDARAAEGIFTKRKSSLSALLDCLG